jgi:hypothetical protein
MPAPVKRLPPQRRPAPKREEKERKRMPLPAKGASRPATETLTLPAEPSRPIDTLFGYTYLFYGDRKIGKTTLAAQFPDPFFLMFEPGGRALSIRQVDIQTWEEFLQYITLLEKNPKYCKTVVIDTGYMAYERCHEYCLAELGLEDPRDDAWGNGWKAIDREFRQAHQRLFNLNIGVIVTAHSEMREVKGFDGNVRDKLVTQLGKQATRYYAGIMDVIAYYTYDKNGNRVLRIQGNEDVEAGHRIKKHFRYTTGQPITFIPMGNSEEEGFKNLLTAFKNQLKQPGDSPGSALNRVNTLSVLRTENSVVRKGGASAVKRM